MCRVADQHNTLDIPLLHCDRVDGSAMNLFVVFQRP
jgi:hypothetical protein